MSAGGKLARRESQFTQMQAMPADMRECVHEFGFAIVTGCLQAGVKTPVAIRNLVRQIWAGARQPTQLAGAEGTLDWLLMQAEANISAARLERVLADFDLRIVPCTPTHEMLEASIAEVSGFTERITKTEKHRRRLTAAIRACRPRFLMARRVA